MSSLRILDWGEPPPRGGWATLLVAQETSRCRIGNLCWWDRLRRCSQSGPAGVIIE